MTVLDALVAQPAPLQLDEDGVLRVGGTRVRLETILAAFNQGSAAEEILLKYPSLKLTAFTPSSRTTCGIGQRSMRM